MASGVHAVHLDGARQFRCLGIIYQRREGFSDLAEQHVCAAVLAIQIAAQLERAMTLRTVRVDRESKQNVPDGHLAIRKDRLRRNRELILTARALPETARRDR